MYLSEIQKCFQKHVGNLDWKFKDVPTEGKEKLWCQHLYKDPDMRSEAIQTCDAYKDAADAIANLKKDSKSNNYQELRRDVTKLEYEVQSFLDSLRLKR